MFETFDWGGIGDANATYGIGGGQAVDGLSSIAFGNGLTAPGTIGTDSDTLAKTYQINEKLTWLKGRHTLKFGGQWLHYDQQRFYAGNNGVLGSFTFNGAFSGAPFSDFLLDLVSGKGRGGGDPDDPWTHLQHRIGLFVQDDFKVTPDLTLNLGLRWAYTSPLVEKDNRQSNFDAAPPFGNGTGVQTFAKDGSLEDRALYSPYYNGWEPRVGVAWSATDRLVLRGGYGISQFMEGTGANLRLPLNPPFFFESNVNYDRTTGAGSLDRRLRGPRPGHDAHRQRARLRPEPAPAVHPAVERVRRVPRDLLHVGPGGLRRPPRQPPRRAGRGQPGPPRRGRPGDVGSQEHAPAALPLPAAHHHDRGRRHRPRTASTTPSRRASVSASGTASSSWRRTPSAASGATTAASTAPAPRSWPRKAPTGQNTYDPEADYGPAFHDVRHNFVFSANYELPWGRGRKWGSDWSGLTNAILGGWKLGGIFQARTGFPVTVIDGRNRSLQGERGNERPNCVGDWKPSNQTVTADSSAPADSRWLDINGFAMAALGTFGDCPVGVGRAPGYSNVDLVLAKRFDVGGPRYLEFRIEAFNALNHPNFGPPARDISNANTFGLITGTVGNPRVIELALKFYF